jgi:5-methylcytosine-specific restriction endonuclease McrA
MARGSFAALSQLSQLSPEAARRRLLAVDMEEKALLAEGLALLGLIDARGDHLQAGYTSMHAYCVGALRMSGDKALKRLQAARLARRVPGVLERVADGRLSVSAVVALAAHLTTENATELLDAAAFRSRDDIAAMLATRARSAAGAATVPGGDGPASSHAPGHVNSPVGAGDDFALAPPGPASSHASAHVDSHAPGHVNSPIRRGQVSRDEQGNYVLRLTFTPGQHAHLSVAQDLLAHAVRDGDPTEVVARALAHYVTHLRRRRFGAGAHASTSELPAAGNTPTRTPPRGRSIPMALRRAVAERDGHAFSFVGDTGHRCGATRGLQFDHVIPVAEGGPTTLANLRLLCAAHNRHEAARVLGRERIHRRREQAERQRARDAEARSRERERQAQRDARTRAEQRPSELIPPLRHLGFTHEQAREGARAAEAIANEPLETRLKLALKTLTRHVLERGERRARAAG